MCEQFNIVYNIHIAHDMYSMCVVVNVRIVEGLHILHNVYIGCSVYNEYIVHNMSNVGQADVLKLVQEETGLGVAWNRRNKLGQKQQKQKMQTFS